MKPSLLLRLLFCLMIAAVAANAQLAKGPKTGSVTGGVLVTTGSYSAESGAPVNPRKLPPSHGSYAPAPLPAGAFPATAAEGSNYLEFPQSITSVGRPVVIQNFQGIPDEGTSIPPDPIMAVGPNHVMALTNSRFRIWDKAGTIIKTIQAGAWYSTALPGCSPFDPKVIYDHFAKRWVMVWLNANTDTTKAMNSHYLISISDDADPTGNWYNYALPSHILGDSASGHWSDYQGVGFDSASIFITSNQFPFKTGPYYVSLRAINKTALYANTGGSVSWDDFWGLRDPVSTSSYVFGTRPAIMHGTSSNYYLVNPSIYTPGTYFTLWKFSYPVTSQSLTAVNIPVTAYRSAPNANQRGGSTTLVEAGGWNVRNEPVYRDSSLWLVHSVASGTGNAYSGVRYVRMNTMTNAVVEDAAVGLEGYWHFYPGIMVDSMKNVVVTFSRSSSTEYIGAYLAGRKAGDPPGLSSPVTIRTGEGNYVKTFGGTRNRWGDYNGIALDPSDKSIIWSFTEYAAAPTNTYGTWVAKIKAGPLPGALMTLDTRAIPFGTINAGLKSDTVSFSITNDGIDTLVISGIKKPSQFEFPNFPATPFTLASLDSRKFQVLFAPTAAGIYNDTIIFTSNDASGKKNILISGRGFAIAKAQSGILYAAAGATDSSRLFIMNSSTGAVSPIGASDAAGLVSIRVHPTTKELIGLDAVSASTSIVRISSGGTFVKEISSIKLTSLKGMDFKDDSTLYVGSLDGSVYEVNMNTGIEKLVASTGQRIGGLAVHPKTKELWMSIRLLGVKDGIYKVDFVSKTAKLVGSTGTGDYTNDILFDKNGKFYGIVGTGSKTNLLFLIDTANGLGRYVGSIDRTGIQAIALSPDAAADVLSDRALAVPTAFSLEQNYPNPFNPNTTIRFAVPTSIQVTLKVYDDLGREVQTLVDGVRGPGVYVSIFDASRLASGIYYYTMKAGAFTDTKKLMLLK